jgi:hypothetical protein
MSEKQDEAWLRAAACEVHARHAPSDLLRDKFRRLRDSWIRVAAAEEIIRSLRPSITSAIAKDHRICTLPLLDEGSSVDRCPRAAIPNRLSSL